MKVRKTRARATNRSPIALAVAMALGTAPAAYAGVAPDDPVGAPVTLFDLTTGNFELTGTASAIDADGDAIVAWISRNNDSGMEGVYYRRINADGSVGNTQTLIEENDVDVNLVTLDVAMDADGDALVAWTIDRVSEGTGRHAEARRITAEGEPAAAAFQVSADVSVDVAVGMDAAGYAAVAWQYAGNILFQRYSATGLPLTETAQQANTTSTGNPYLQISVSPNGHFVIGWRDGGLNLIARPYSPVTGDPVADEVTVASGANQWPVRFAMDADGDFSAAWAHSTSTYTPSGDPYMPMGSYTWDVYVSAKRFDANGNPLTGPVQLYHDGASGMGPPMPMMNNPAVKTLNYGIDGDIVVGWDTPAPVFNRSKVMLDGAVIPLVARFDASGCPSFSPVGNCLTELVTDADDDRLIVYSAFDDSSRPTGIHAQRYKGPESADLAVTLATSASEVAVGDALTLTLTVENLHPLDSYYGNTSMDQTIGAAAGVQVEFDVPAAFAFPADTGEWTCAQVAESVSCTHPDPLHAADTITLEAVYAPSAGDIGEYVLAATASAIPIDPETANNASAVSVTVKPAPEPDTTDDGSGADTGNDDGTDTDDDNVTPVTNPVGGGGALGWLTLLLASPGLFGRKRKR